MTKAVFLCASIFALLVADGAAFAAEQSPSGHRAPSNAPSPANSAGQDCDSRLQTLDDSKAEGEERLTEKYKVIDVCAGEYAHDRTIKQLVKECTKFAEQPVLKQQFLADCQLAAFKYANALRDLKAEYKK